MGLHPGVYVREGEYVQEGGLCRGGYALDFCSRGLWSGAYVTGAYGLANSLHPGAFAQWGFDSGGICRGRLCAGVCGLRALVFGLYSLAYIRGDVALGGLGSETYVRGLMTREFTSGGAYVRVTGDLTSGALCPGVYMYMLRLMSEAFALGVFSSGTGRFMSGGLRYGSRRLHQLPQSSLRVGWYRLYLASLSAGFCTRSLRSGGRLFQEAYKRGLMCRVFCPRGFGPRGLC